ncbi:MAG: hypothetical protein NZ822_01945 [Patescibacteria group bacterium]|nr:hypothetical protein [Patescibacteria group bacterium]
MTIIIRLLPIILLCIIFYIFFTDLYPKYQEILKSVQKLNELRIKEREISSTENLIKSLENNQLIASFSKRKDLLNIWLPTQPNQEELLIYLTGLYNAFSLPANLPVINEGGEKRFYQEVLPIKILNFGLKYPSSNNYQLFVDTLEKNVRLTRIKDLRLTPKEVELGVETYYFPLKNE